MKIVNVRITLITPNLMVQTQALVRLNYNLKRAIITAEQATHSHSRGVHVRVCKHLPLSWSYRQLSVISPSHHACLEWVQTMQATAHQLRLPTEHSRRIKLAAATSRPIALMPG